MKQRKSPRLRGYDYCLSGYYFVTICTKDRMHYFGEIDGGEMVLNDLGRYVLHCRNEIPNYFDHVEIDTFVCMPNHIHGIIVIRNPVGTRIRVRSHQTGTDERTRTQICVPTPRTDNFQ